MNPKHYIGIVAVAAALQFFNSSTLRAQNSYPSSGDACIHSLTIGLQCDGRYKRNITQNVPGLAFINKLAPVTYTLDINGIDMNGATVKTVALSGSGYGQLRLQTDQLAGGTYIYSLFVDGRLVDTKKLIVGK